MIFDNNNNLINIQVEYNNNYLIIYNNIIYHYFTGLLIFDDIFINENRLNQFINKWGNNSLFYFGLSELDNFDFSDTSEPSAVFTTAFLRFSFASFSL